MKRISIFAIVLLLVVADISAGHPRYRGSWYRRLRWSIHTQSLVPSDLYYNPYAHGYGRSGLVPYWVRYSPYAHGVKHPSGLVNDYACSMGSTYYCPEKALYRGACSMDVHLHQAAAEDSSHNSAETKQTRENYLAQIKARRAHLRQLAQARTQERALNKSRGKETIVTYLKANDIDFRMSRLLSVEGKILSADFVLGDGRTVISYWDPVEIQALEGQAEHKTLLYQNYIDSWKNFCTHYQRAGGNIFQIVSTDREEILAQLTRCDESVQTQTTYAMAHSEYKP